MTINCPSCASLNGIGAKFCSNCGSSLVSSADAPQASSGATSYNPYAGVLPKNSSPQRGSSNVKVVSKPKPVGNSRVWSALHHGAGWGLFVFLVGCAMLIVSNSVAYTEEQKHWGQLVSSIPMLVGGGLGLLSLIGSLLYHIFLVFDKSGMHKMALTDDVPWVACMIISACIYVSSTIWHTYILFIAALICMFVVTPAVYIASKINLGSAVKYIALIVGIPIGVWLLSIVPKSSSLPPVAPSQTSQPQVSDQQQPSVIDPYKNCDMAEQLLELAKKKLQRDQESYENARTNALGSLYGDDAPRALGALVGERMRVVADQMTVDDNQKVVDGCHSRQ